MAGMSESCSVCSRPFEVQFRYQMEEKDGGFLFFCSQECQGKSVRGETTSGVLCDACGKRFVVDLVSQVVKTKAGRKYACSDACRSQVLAEAGGVRLAAFAQAPEAPESVPSIDDPDEPEEANVIAPAAVAAAPAASVPSIASVASIASAPRAAAAAPASSRKKIAGPRRLAIFNHKGGTGKTTTSVSIAAGLAARGLKVLLVDTDSQGNVGVSLGVKAERTLYHMLVMGLKPSAAAVNVRENLDLVVSNETLAAAELYLAGRQNRDRILRERLTPAEDQYDVILLDCSPSLSLMNQNALCYADSVVIPVSCDYLALVGVKQCVRTLRNVHEHLKHPVYILGVVPTFYDARHKLGREVVDTLKARFGDLCMPTVRSNMKLREAPAARQTIFEFAPDSHGAEDYAGVVQRVLAALKTETRTRATAVAARVEVA